MRFNNKSIMLLNAFKSPVNTNFQAVQLSLTGLMMLPFFKLCHVTWMQSQLLRHPEKWGMCRCCPSIQNMLWSTDNAFHYRGLGEYLIMFTRPEVPATACAENPKELFHTMLQLCSNLSYTSSKWRVVLLLLLLDVATIWDPI